MRHDKASIATSAAHGTRRGERSDRESRAIARVAETPRLDRRTFLAGGLGLAAASVLPLGTMTARMARAQSMITKTTTRIVERLPAIGLGTFLAFDLLPGKPRSHLQEVVRRFWDLGGRVIDTSPLYGTGEVNVGDLSSALGINDDLFITNKIWATGSYLADDRDARRSIETSLQRLWRERIDVVYCHNLVNVEFIVPLLAQMKREGLVRYIGVSHHEEAYFAALANWIERGEIDAVQVHYSIALRAAEQRILPAAQERGIGVFANMPLEKARLFAIVKDRPLPDFAKELQIESWAQFFLKWVISHPAVTCALPATSNPEHLTDNMGALRGPLPDRALRARMLRYMESLPGFSDLARMPWYPDKDYSGIIRRAQQRLSDRT